jgi:hypothetical protein
MARENARLPADMGGVTCPVPYMTDHAYLAILLSHNLVHGAAETVANAAACRDRAVRIAIESMRQLYATPTLLKIKDSAARGGVILVGAHHAESPGPMDDAPTPG